MHLVEINSIQSFELDDKSSLEDVYRQYWSKLYIYAFNVLREREICEDIVQKIFVDLWTRRYNNHITDLNAYLYQAIKFQIFNHFRESKRKKKLLIRFNQTNSPYKLDELYEKKELQVHINDVISRLPKRQRIIFQMSRYEGFSSKEISEKLNISLQTVKNHISESLKFIRKSLKNFRMLFF